jgi:hypothetical protein
MSEKAVKVEADTVHIKVKCKPKNGEKKATPSTSAAPAAPAAAPAKRKASEKQLEHLKKAREARAAKKVAEGGTSKPAPSTSKAAEKPAEKPKEFDFDALRDRARVVADKVPVFRIKNIYLGIGTSAQVDKRNREEAVAIIAKVLRDIGVTYKKGAFIHGGNGLTDKQERLLVKAVGVTLRQKYLDSKDSKDDEKDERSKDRPTQIGNTLLMFSNDEKSMKELGSELK